MGKHLTDDLHQYIPQGMETERGTRRVYWPKSGLSRTEGIVVGWRIDDTIVVVGIVEQWLNQQSHQDLGLDIIGYCGQVGSIATGSRQGLCFEIGKDKSIRSFPTAQIVLYDPPDPRRLRYLSVGDMALHPGPSAISTVDQDGYGIGVRRRKYTGLEEVAPLLNKAKTAQRRLRTSPRTSSASSPYSVSGSRLYGLATFAMTPLVYGLRMFVLASGLRPCGALWGSIGRHSSTCHQLAMRSQQILEAPKRFTNTLHQPDIPFRVRSGRYVRFWNTVWLIMNDLLLGYCASGLLRQASPLLRGILPSLFERCAIQPVVGALKWLDDWPVGLKLNTPLSRFFRSTFEGGITQWGYIVGPLLSKHLPLLLRLASTAGLGGATLLLAIVRDVIALLTLHLRTCHEITVRLVKWQLSSLGGLWNLFRGKKWNVLRQRTDSYAYDVDQLFLGTLLFTVSAFLFPTVLTYAALFAIIRLGLWTTDWVLAFVIKGLNAFPLFEVLLRLKEPSRLPDGLVFKVRTVTGRMGGEDGVAMLEIKNSPRSMSSILFGPRHDQA